MYVCLYSENLWTPALHVHLVLQTGQVFVVFVFEFWKYIVSKFRHRAGPNAILFRQSSEKRKS